MSATKTKKREAAGKAAEPSTAERIETDALAAWENFRLCSRKSVVALWEAGKLLKRVREINGGAWKDWCKEHGVALATANQAIRLYKWDRSGDKIKECDDITDAKIAAGIVAGRVPRKAVARSTETESGDKSGFGAIDTDSLDFDHRTVCESIGNATDQMEEIIGELGAEEVPVVAEIIEATIERLRTLRSKIG